MHDIVIIGAGLAGSGVATALARRGWDVALIERRQLPHHTVCGEFLSPESQGSLRALGLYDAAAALHPAVIPSARLISRGGVELRMPLPGPAWGISRFALDLALAQAAGRAGARVQLGATVTEVRADGGGYQLDIRDAQGQPATVRSRAIIGAYGRHPLPGLRPAADAASTRPTYVGVKCHYEQLDLPPEVRLFLFQGGYVGVSSIEGGRANVCMLVARTAFTQAGSVRAMIAAAARMNPAFGRQLAGGHALAETEVAVAPVDTGRAATPWEHFARVGDAAVMIPPLCGDGMAMALRSAELCAPLADQFLRGECTLDDWAGQYRAAWHHEFDAPVWMGRSLQRMLGLSGLGGALLGLGALLPPLSARLVQATRGQLRPQP